MADVFESFVGLDYAYGRLQRIIIVALIFVSTFLFREFQKDIDLGDMALDRRDHHNSSTYNCFNNGSLHELALGMFSYSSPPGSTSYKKLKHVLDLNSLFFIDMGGMRDIFSANTECMRRMLRGYGLKEVLQRPSVPNDITIVETLFTEENPCPISNENCRNHSRILIQTEQYYTHARWSEFDLCLSHCHRSPNCVILEFSDFNYLQAKKEGLENSFVLLPVMTTNPSRLSPFEPDIPIDLQDRSIDIAFLGTITNRRTYLQQEMVPYLKSHPDRKVTIKFNIRNFDVADSYKNTKVCLVMHSYDAIAGGEYHRFSEFGPFGCIP
eukprot:CAMPEP_0183714394 /NCGR_PEP_ID=MMETSP0737-20130205/8916_1 /TAXON_ID=385413 /ORGANISM="Thalassiosira miniscula, Strain CCMP1093" /LENGTH=324 /DNA_ID=CAMNT_0025943309 /DNA_START=48 /DNA_END=1018 /DNA_ORIENTATION=+